MGEAGPRVRIDRPRDHRLLRKRAGIIGFEDRRPESPSVPMRRRDERGAKVGEYTENIPFWVGFINPGISYAVDIARLSEVGYHVYKGLRDGDILRMPEGARQGTDLEKQSYLEDYLLDRFDRTNRIAKIAYHEKKFRRHARRAGIGLAVFGGFIALERIFPNIREATIGRAGTTGGYIAEGVLGILAGSGVIEGLLAARERSEIRNIKTRAGKVEKRKKKGPEGEVTEEKYTDEVFREQVFKAVEFIQLYADNPARRDAYAQSLYLKLRDIRDKKRAAYHAFTDKQRADIVRVARKLERLDYLIDHPTRLLARMSRRIVDRTSHAGLIEKRTLIRDNYTFHFVEGQGNINVYSRNIIPPRRYRDWGRKVKHPAEN